MCNWTHYIHLKRNGAGGENRTPDLMITNQLLYLLSYSSINVLVTLQGRGYVTVPTGTLRPSQVFSHSETFLTSS